jgi:hypothetical protein
MKRDRRELTLGRIRLSHAREALELIADIAEGSTTANSLPHIGKLARSALARSNPDEPSHESLSGALEPRTQERAGSVDAPDDVDDAELRDQYDHAIGRAFR